MTRRWFFSFVRQGVSAGISANVSVTPHVVFSRRVGGGARPNEVASGPAMRLTSADDVATIAAGLVWREEPPPGTPAAAENVLASVEFSHADLPWLLSTRSVRPPNGADEQPLPWLVLLVVSAAEAAPPRDADPAPILTVPVSALPPLDESWAWAHVEARLPDSADLAGRRPTRSPRAARTRSGAVVARLLSPRKLTPDTEWIAAVVPVPSAGAWPAPAAGANAIELRVFHWWRFRTGASGSFEDLARRLKKADAHDLGLGARSVDVSAPFPGDARPAEVTASVDLDGALRAPGPAPVERWTDPDAQAAFRARMTALLNAPAKLRRTPAEDEPLDGGAVDRDEVAVGPPLYGSHHTGEQTVSRWRQRVAHDPQSGREPPGSGIPRHALRAARAGVPHGSRLGAGRRDPGGEPCPRGGGTRGRRVAGRPEQARSAAVCRRSRHHDGADGCAPHDAGGLHEHRRGRAPARRPRRPYTVGGHRDLQGAGRHDDDRVLAPHPQRGSTRAARPSGSRTA